MQRERWGRRGGAKRCGARRTMQQTQHREHPAPSTVAGNVRTVRSGIRTVGQGYVRFFRGLKSTGLSTLAQSIACTTLQSNLRRDYLQLAFRRATELSGTAGKCITLHFEFSSFPSPSGAPKIQRRSLNICCISSIQITVRSPKSDAMQKRLIQHDIWQMWWAM